MRKGIELLIIIKRYILIKMIKVEKKAHLNREQQMIQMIIEGHGVKVEVD